MESVSSREIELILFAEKFQKTFHGVAALDFYLEALSKMNSLLQGDVERTDFEKWVIHKSAFKGLGVAIDASELVKRRQAVLRVLATDAKFIFPGHPDYPTSLLRIAEPPFLLSYRGQAVWKHQSGLAVVGSREAHPMSLEWMDANLAGCLDKIKFFTASGGARGVDQKTHALSLAKGLPTVVFVPSGLGCLYPQNLEGFVQPVIDSGGAIVSEYSYFEPMRKHYFHARNRLISGVAACTLIIQAARKSGTLITGRQALEQGKAVLIVPSHPLDVGFQGGLDLLMEGATLVRDRGDLMVLLQSEFAAFRASMTHKDSEQQSPNSHS